MELAGLQPPGFRVLCQGRFPELLLTKYTTDRREIYIQMQTIGQPPRGFAPTGAGKEAMEEIKKLTKEEEMDVGRQIYDRLLTIPIAAEKFGVTYSAAGR